MKTLLNFIHHKRKLLLAFLGATFITLCVYALIPVPQNCPQAIHLNKEKAQEPLLNTGFEAVPLKGIDESILKLVKPGEKISVLVIDTGKTFEKLKVLSHLESTILLEVPEKQAQELSVAQHQKISLRLASFTPNAEGAAPDTTYHLKTP